MEKKYRERPKRPIISGVIWLGLGLFILARSRGWIPDTEESWPLLLVIIGVALIIGAAFRRTSSQPADDPHLPS
jgi:hypothetical protein